MERDRDLGAETCPHGITHRDRQSQCSKERLLCVFVFLVVFDGNSAILQSS